MTSITHAEEALNNVNTYSNPSQLRITDIRFADISGAPMHCGLIKIYTNQGIVGLGEVRDNGCKVYAQILKSRLIGENPCNVDKLFRRIKQFGGPSRQGGGVSGIEVALWDLAGKAYGVPVYQLLGGKFRDKVRMYCDTDIDSLDGKEVGRGLKARMDLGFTFLKMDLGVAQLDQMEGMLSYPLGFQEGFKQQNPPASWLNPGSFEERLARNRCYDYNTVDHPFTGVQITEKGLDFLEEFMSDVRSIIGPTIPIALDHLGHMPMHSSMRLAERLAKYNPAWLEDCVPWYYTDQYVRMNAQSPVPICTGEDIYLKENFRPLIERGGVSVIHPDLLTAGGILETKKVGDMAQEYGIPMAIHMAESPIACMAAAHAAVATENFLALEFHSVDVPWWDDIVVGNDKPMLQDGYITVSDKPGLGIEDFNDEVLKAHIHPDIPGLWQSTEEWDNLWSNDRLWS